MPTPEQIEVAGSLARLAAIDLATAEKLAPDPEMDPWAAEFRYGDAPIETLNRDEAIAVANVAVTWCQELLDGKRS